MVRSDRPGGGTRVTLWQGVLLGILQGVTEFLPVSSSGHLALAQMLIPGFEQPGVIFDVLLHAGTGFAVVWYERHQISEWLHTAVGRRILGLLLLGTVATSIVALPLRNMAEQAFERPLWVGDCSDHDRPDCCRHEVYSGWICG